MFTLFPELKRVAIPEVAAVLMLELATLSAAGLIPNSSGGLLREDAVAVEITTPPGSGGVVEAARATVSFTRAGTRSLALVWNVIGKAKEQLQ